MRRMREGECPGRTNHVVTPLAGALSGLQQLLDNADRLSDKARARLRRLTPTDPYIILPYAGFGTARSLRINGRVLRNPSGRISNKDDSRWRNLLETYKRFESDELAGAQVRCSFLGSQMHVVTDSEGYFQCELN